MILPDVESEGSPVRVGKKETCLGCHSSIEEGRPEASFGACVVFPTGHTLLLTPGVKYVETRDY